MTSPEACGDSQTTSPEASGDFETTSPEKLSPAVNLIIKGAVRWPFLVQILLNFFSDEPKLVFHHHLASRTLGRKDL